MAIVYLHRRNDTNKVFYVGIGQQERRAYRTDNRNDLWTKIYKRHGRTVEIIYKDISFEDACNIEIKLIAFYRAYLGEKSLANFAIGGQKGNFGKIYTDEQRKNISIAQKKRYENPEELKKHKERLKKAFNTPEYLKKRSEITKAMYEKDPTLREKARQKTIQQIKENPKFKEILAENARKNWSNEEYRKKHKQATIAAMNRPEIKERVSKARFGRKMHPNTLNKIIESNLKIILNTQTGVFYFGIKEAAKSLGVSPNGLQRKLTNVRRNNTNFLYV